MSITSPDLKFSKGYDVEWTPVPGSNPAHKFHYCLIEIDETDVLKQFPKRNWKKLDKQTAKKS